MPIPDVQVLLDDGTGTFPHDVSGYARLDAGKSISRGREDEFANINPSTLGLTFDNSDGLFTLGAPTYGIRVGQKIRVTVNDVDRFTGYVNRWPVAWQGGTGKVALARVSATCELARLSRWPMRSLIEETILATQPWGYWTLGDASGSTQAADSSGNLQAPPLLVVDTGAPVVFGNAVGVSNDGLTAAEFAVDQYLRTIVTPYTPGDPVSFRGSFAITALPGSARPLMAFGAQKGRAGFALGITVNAAGEIATAIGGTPSSTTADVTLGETCNVALTYDGTNVRIYFEDALVFGPTAVSPPPFTGHFSVGDGITGTGSHVAVYPGVVLAAQQVADMAGATDTTISSVELLERTAALTGAPTGALDASLTNIDVPDLNGKSASEVLSEVAAAEVGLVYFDGTGDLRFHNRGELPLRLDPDLTISTSDSEMIGVDTEVDVDVNDVINYATGQRSGGGTAQTLSDQDSIDRYGRFRQDVNTWVTTDDEARDRAGWAMYNNLDPRPKIRRLSLDLLTATDVEVEAVLALDLGSRIRLDNLPPQAPVAADGWDVGDDDLGEGTTLGEVDGMGDLLIEGWTEAISLTEWTLTLNVSAWEPQSAWVIENATYGVLDDTTKLYV